MGEEFDMNAAMSEMANGLGFEDSGDGGDSDTDLPADDIDNLVDNAVDTQTTTPEAGAGSPGAGSEDKPGDGTDAPAPGTPTPDSAAAPRTWRPEAAAAWATVPPVVQAEIIKREEDMWRGIEQYKVDAGFGKTIQSVLEPFMPVLQQHRLDPITTINQLLNAQYQLSMGTLEQKVNMFQSLMKDYNIELDHLTGLVDIPKTDPEVARLRQELGNVQSTLNQRQQADIAAANDRANTEVNSFASDPKNIHFDAVAPDIVRLIQGGVCTTLQEAYDKAVWANPVTRAAEITRQTTEKDAALAAQKREQAEKAKNTLQTNVRSRARSASTATPLRSMEDTMKETLAKIHARDSK